MISTIINAAFAVVGQLEKMYIFTDFADISILKALCAFGITGMIISLFLAGRLRKPIFL